jgi:hypothetical protein
MNDAGSGEATSGVLDTPRVNCNASKPQLLKFPSGAFALSWAFGAVVPSQDGVPKLNAKPF